MRIGLSESSSLRTRRKQDARESSLNTHGAGCLETAPITIGMPQNPQERFARRNPRSAAKGDSKIVAHIFPKPMDHAIRNPDDGIEEVQDGGKSLQSDDKQIAAPNVRQLMKQDPSQLL